MKAITLSGKYMKPLKLMAFTGKASQSCHKRFRLLSMLWSELETSATYLARRFHQEHRHHMMSHLKLPSK